METTKTSKFTRQSKSFISVFFSCQVSACQLQPFSCHDLANDISSQTAKTVFSNLNAGVVYVQSWRYWPWKTLSSHLNHNICSLVYLFQLRPVIFDDWLIPSSCLHISPLFLKIKDHDHFEDSKVPSNVTSRNIPIILKSDKWDICDYADLLRFFTGYVLCAVSLLTLVAIGIDRSDFSPCYWGWDTDKLLLRGEPLWP